MIMHLVLDHSKATILRHWAERSLACSQSFLNGKMLPIKQGLGLQQRAMQTATKLLDQVHASMEEIEHLLRVIHVGGGGLRGAVHAASSF